MKIVIEGQKEQTEKVCTLSFRDSREMRHAKVLTRSIDNEADGTAGSGRYRLRGIEI